MRQLLITLVLSLGFCLVVANPSPDFGIPTAIDYVSVLSPNVYISSAKVVTANSKISIALAAFKASLLNGTTDLANSGKALLEFTEKITVLVGGVLINLSTYSRDTKTTPSSIFATLNQNIDAALAFIDQSGELVERIKTTSGAKTAEALNAIVTLMKTALNDIGSKLDEMSTAISEVIAAGTYTKAFASAKVGKSITLPLTAAIEQLITAQNTYATLLTGVRLGFQRSNDQLVRFYAENLATRSAINETQRVFNTTLVTLTKIMTDRAAFTQKTINNALTASLNVIIPFMADSTTKENATKAYNTIVSNSQQVSDVANEFSDEVSTILTSVFTGSENVTQNATQDISLTLETAAMNLSASVAENSANAVTCNSAWGPLVFEMNVRTTATIQMCINREIPAVGKLLTIFYTHMTMIESQFLAHVARVNQCSSLGTVKSQGNTKAAISACYFGFANSMEPIVKDQYSQVYMLRLVMEFEAVSQIQRLQNCVESGMDESMAEALSLQNSITTCLTTANVSL